MKKQLIMILVTAASLSVLADVNSRTLWWKHDGGGDFNAAANWLVDDAEPAETEPSEPDTLRFRGVGCTKDSDWTMQLSANTVVSNFEYKVEKQAGKLMLDLNSKVLTVNSDLHFFTQGNGTVGSELYVKDGTIEVINSFVGTTTYGAPNEDRSGFFVNRSKGQNGGLKAIIDNVDFARFVK